MPHTIVYLYLTLAVALARDPYFKQLLYGTYSETRKSPRVIHTSCFIAPIFTARSLLSTLCNGTTFVGPHVLSYSLHPPPRLLAAVIGGIIMGLTSSPPLPSG